MTNRWRLALLGGTNREVARMALTLVRSGRPRLAGIALAAPLNQMASKHNGKKRCRRANIKKFRVR